jgi:hypothetical protein
MIDTKFEITLQTVEDFLLQKSEEVGIASWMILFNNIENLPFASVTLAHIKISASLYATIRPWCNANFTGKHHYDRANGKFYFEDDGDAIIFYFTWAVFG